MKNSLLFLLLVCFSATLFPQIVLFSNGNAYTPPNPVPGTDNNPVGRFYLSNDGPGDATLIGVSIRLTGTTANITRAKLWASTNNTFNAAVDNLRDNTVFISTSIGFSPSITIPAFQSRYFFLTLDLNASASGNFTSVIQFPSDLIFGAGSLLGSFSNAPLASGAIPLPVELTTFSVQRTDGALILNWQTSTEVNNYGFEVERSLDKLSWSTLGFVQGSGNSNSPKSYRFEDKGENHSGRVFFRLKQIDTDGSAEYSRIIEWANGPSGFQLSQNYPNPFNPSTTITYQLAEATDTELKVYDILGTEVATLAKGFQQPGSYSVQFDASALPSGSYVCRLRAGESVKSIKLMLAK